MVIGTVGRAVVGNKKKREDSCWQQEPKRGHRLVTKTRGRRVVVNKDRRGERYC